MTNTNTAPVATHRARWAAIGAAVAITLGAGGLGVARATSPDGATAYVAITPCRLLDTRNDPNFRVGPHGTLAGNAQITVEGWGAQGQCTTPAPDLPTGTTGLQLNVTAVGASEPTFLTFFPGSDSRPNASSLNPAPGQPPAPNAVTTRLDGEGRFSVYNRFGNVDVIVDVVGYYIDHQHTGTDVVDESLTGADVADNSLTGAEIADDSLTGADIADGSISGADVGDESITGADVADNSLTGAEIADDSLTGADVADESGLATRTTIHNPLLQLTAQASEVAYVRLRVPADGYVTVYATIRWNESSPDEDVADCVFLVNGESGGGQRGVRLHDYGYAGNWNATATGHQTFEVSTSGNVGGPALNGHRFTVECSELDGDVGIESVMFTAQYFPTWYAPSLIFQG